MGGMGGMGAMARWFGAGEAPENIP
jgi:hypothetical protein